MQALVSCSGGRTTACNPHSVGGDQCGEPRPHAQHHNNDNTDGVTVMAERRPTTFDSEQARGRSSPMYYPVKGDAAIVGSNLKRKWSKNDACDSEFADAGGGDVLRQGASSSALQERRQTRRLALFMSCQDWDAGTASLCNRTKSISHMHPAALRMHRLPVLAELPEDDESVRPPCMHPHGKPRCAVTETPTKAFPTRVNARQATRVVRTTRSATMAKTQTIATSSPTRFGQLWVRSGSFDPRRMSCRIRFCSC